MDQDSIMDEGQITDEYPATTIA